MDLQSFARHVGTVIVTMFIVSTLPAFAIARTSQTHSVQFGGANGGGGNDIEAGFKARIISIANMLQGYSKSSQNLLKFSPSQLSILSQIPNAMMPLCATGTRLTQIQKMQKMAYVFSDTLNVINLDCDKYTLDDWNKIYSSNQPKDIIFLIHEGLRVLRMEGENDYGRSSTFILAYNHEKQFELRTMLDLASPRGIGRCRLVFTDQGTANGSVPVKQFFGHGTINYSYDSVEADFEVDGSPAIPSINLGDAVVVSEYGTTGNNLGLNDFREAIVSGDFSAFIPGLYEWYRFRKKTLDYVKAGYCDARNSSSSAVKENN